MNLGFLKKKEYKVFLLLCFVYCVLLECVLNSCNVCYLSVVSYCCTTATGLKSNCS
jgi:hypothetical protein